MPSSNESQPKSSYPALDKPDFVEHVRLNGEEWPIYGYKFDRNPNAWPKTGGIYAISRDYDEGRRHLVGKTGEFRGRWRFHRRDVRKGKHENSYFQASFNKHGESGFVFWVLEAGVALERQGEREAFWYHFLESDKKANGWNILVPTADGNWKLSEETKAKLRQINLGKTHSPETRIKMSQSRMGDKNCNWGKKGILNPLFGRKQPQMSLFISRTRRGADNPNWGKPHSQEVRHKISAGNPKSMPVLMRSPTGDETEFVSVRRAAENCGVTACQMRLFLQRGEAGQSINGWTLLEIHPTYFTRHG